MRLHLYLYALGPLRKALSNFVILMRWLISEAVRAVVQWFLEMIVERAVHWQIFFGGGVGFYPGGQPTNRCPLRSFLLYSNGHAILVSFAHHPWTPILSMIRTSPSETLLLKSVISNLHFSFFAMATLRAAFRRLHTGYFIILGVGMAR